MTGRDNPRELLNARYGTEIDWEPGERNDTLDVILSHRSVRRWLDETVSEEQIRTIVAAAQSAPSSSNKQTVSVVAVQDAGIKKELQVVGRQMFNHIETAPVVLIWCIDHSIARLLAERDGKELGALEYFDEAGLGFLDAGIMAQNAAIAAESMGLGTVYLGSMRNDMERVQELLHLPTHVVPVVGLAIGHPDPTERAGIQPRLPQEAVLHWDVYGAPRPELVDAYDTALNTYYSRYGQHQLWSHQFVSRLGAEIIIKTSRRLVRRVLEKAGFGLR
ncbi:nitroreductase family protein [Corynebacterium efficiens YS-314]|uniref:Putative nitro/flavin reductase n=1 Tax=Corynebacterium efficiens (strain DSM 44549 / YS-314 / AJ 12310 / JCM 11189 / NBRC 100395) TaxID=196164 RepID=Q8FM59_COREF|nr:NADPH-dependent oxidoreductase [Corynebacterium efficiens]EEW51140.1 nitroreductase family protein [Corynebacterium efficiens YS-314]BAC19458.1 putative nitro/flavin reductase [Corynebacterium efficiens YS-314]